MLLKRLDVVREAPEYDAERLVEPELPGVVSIHAERGGHAALALDALLERDFLEVALPIVAPGVIHAREGFCVASGFERDQRASMRASVLECVELAVGVPGDDDRRIADEGRHEIAGLLHFDGETQVVPGFSSEDPALLLGVHITVLEDPERHARQAATWPCAFGGALRAFELLEHRKPPASNSTDLPGLNIVRITNRRPT